MSARADFTVYLTATLLFLMIFSEIMQALIKKLICTADTVVKTGVRI